MRTLATTLRAILRHQNRHAVQPVSAIGGFSRSPVQMPPEPQPFTAAALPIGVDHAGDPVRIGSGGVLISGDPKTGVSSTVRMLTVHAAKFPAARLHVYDHSGEWVLMRILAHRFVTRAHGIADGLSDDLAASQVLDDLQALHVEMQRRNDHLAGINDDLAAAGHTQIVNRVADLIDLPLPVAQAAGINPDRLDTDTAGLHRHVVIIPNAAWWIAHLPHGIGAAIADELFWLAGVGDDLGIHLVLATHSRDLAVIPAALRARIATRITLRITDPVQADLIIGEPARLRGIDATHAEHRAPLLAWITGTEGAGHRHRLVQLYRCSPMRLHRSIGWNHHDRDRSGRLTGDAIAINDELAAHHAEQATRRTDDNDQDRQ